MRPGAILCQQQVPITFSDQQKKGKKIKQKKETRERSERRRRGRGRGRVNDVATCFSLAASMMMADYRLHQESTDYRLSLPSSTLCFSLACFVVLSFPLPSLPCPAPSLPATAVPINDFNYMRISRVYSCVCVSVCLHLRRSRPAKWRPTELCFAVGKTTAPALSGGSCGRCGNLPVAS